MESASNATSEKLAPRSRGFREVFVQFITFSDFFESFQKRVELFGCVRMCSDAVDAFRCVGKRSDTYETFPIFVDDVGDFWSFLRLGGLLLWTFYV